MLLVQSVKSRGFGAELPGDTEVRKNRIDRNSVDRGNTSHCEWRQIMPCAKVAPERSPMGTAGSSACFAM